MIQSPGRVFDEVSRNFEEVVVQRVVRIDLAAVAVVVGLLASGEVLVAHSRLFRA